MRKLIVPGVPTPAFRRRGVTQHTPAGVYPQARDSGLKAVLPTIVPAGVAQETMTMLSRRTWLSAAAAAAAGGATGLGRAATNASARPPQLPQLDIVIPAGTGGGWDQTGRALGAALQGGGLVKDIAYENKGGKGGTLGLADFVQRRATQPNALFISGFVMVGALALNQTPEALRQLSPLARLTSDYPVLCVAPGKGIATLDDLVRLLKRDVAAVGFTGGSAGGVDHMLAAMVLRQLGLDAGAMSYLPTSSGKEALDALTAGRARVAISGYSEFKTAIDEKHLLPLAVSSRKKLFGIGSLREQGIDTELSNWRGVFASAALAVPQKDALRKLVLAATETPQWRQALLDNSWVGSLLYGKELDSFVEVQQGVATIVAGLLKLKR